MCFILLMYPLERPKSALILCPFTHLSSTTINPKLWLSGGHVRFIFVSFKWQNSWISEGYRSKWCSSLELDTICDMIISTSFILVYKSYDCGCDGYWKGPELIFKSTRMSIHTFLRNSAIKFWNFECKSWTWYFVLWLFSLN
jgi:hypothetical protein